MKQALKYGIKAAESIMKNFTVQELVPKGEFAYYHGVFMTGLQRLYEKTGDEAYFEYIRDWVDDNISENGAISRWGDWPSFLSLNFRRSGTLLFMMYGKTGEKRYLEFLKYLTETMRFYRKNKYGGYWHYWGTPNEMWLDGLYMSEPLCVMYGAFTGQAEFFDMAIKQAKIMWEHCRDHETGLLYHGWDPTKKAKWADPQTGRSPEVWGRALGWYTAALCDILDYIPTEHPGREDIVDMLNTLLKTIISYQDPIDGRWYQVVDKGYLEGNWLETSCSCQFTYSIAKAIQKGYLEKGYVNHAIKGYEGIANALQYDEKGTLLVENICEGTGIGDLDFYLNRRRVTNDLHGSATFIMMCCQMEELRQFLEESL